MFWLGPTAEWELSSKYLETLKFAGKCQNPVDINKSSHSVIPTHLVDLFSAMQKLLGILLPLLFVSSALAAIGDFFHGKSHAINHVADRIGRHHDHDSQEYDKRHDYDDLKHYISGHDIKFPCQATKNIYVSSGRYEPRNIIANRLQIGRDHAYVAVPRLRTGVPFTLARIHLRKTCSTTLLEPYPCWSIQEEGNCEALQSVVDLVLDEKVRKLFLIISILSDGDE